MNFTHQPSQTKIVLMSNISDKKYRRKDNSLTDGKKIKTKKTKSNQIKHESPITDYLKSAVYYNGYFSISDTNKEIRIKTFNRMVGTRKQKLKDGMIYKDPVVVVEKKISPEISINLEAFPFLFHLNGCPKNLLFFIIGNLVDHATGNFKMNTHVIMHFQKHASSFFNEEYKTDTIKQANRELVEKNIICNIKNGQYRINPLVFSNGNETYKRLLFRQYTDLLISKGKNPINYFYPRMKKGKQKDVLLTKKELIS